MTCSDTPVLLDDGDGFEMDGVAVLRGDALRFGRAEECPGRGDAGVALKGDGLAKGRGRGAIHDDRSRFRPCKTQR